MWIGALVLGVVMWLLIVWAFTVIGGVIPR